MYTMPVDTPDGKPAVPKLVSTGKGRTTCGYFFPTGDRILFSSTFAASAECPPPPDYSQGYVWPIYNTYEIYTAKPDGSESAPSDASHRGYNAESTITPRRQAHRLHIHAQRRPRHLHDERRRHQRPPAHARTGLRRRRLSGPYDGKKIVYRAEHPQTPEQIADYKDCFRARPDSSRQSGNLGDERRRQATSTR